MTKITITSSNQEQLDFIKKVNEVYTNNKTMVIATKLNDGQRDIFDNTHASKSKDKFN